MRFYSKSVLPKDYVDENSDIVKSIKEDIARRIGSAIADYMEFEAQDDCIHHPWLQDKHGWAREYVGSIDISIPTKLMPMGGVYVCENCFSNNNIPRSYSIVCPVPKYCECCGAHFTNVELANGRYFIKRKGANNEENE